MLGGGVPVIRVIMVYGCLHRLVTEGSGSDGGVNPGVAELMPFAVAQAMRRQYPYVNPLFLQSFTRSSYALAENLAGGRFAIR
jgi:hypothetical protein